MCGRFTLARTVGDIEELVGDLDNADEVPLAPRYNIAPSQPILTVLSDAPRRLRVVEWGLIPHWAKDPSIGNKLINARSETAREKPSFRSCFKSTRCLVFADGFYEWTLRPGETTKTPMYIQLRSRAPFAFAGLWSHWQGGDGTERTTATILTTRTNSLLKPIHHRMPVILAPNDFAAWLDISVYSVDALQALLEPYPADAMQASAVSRHVNNVRNDDPRCVEPVESPAPDQPDLFA